MTDIETRLRELHGAYCDGGFCGDPCSSGCEWSEAIREAARIGAEFERVKFRTLARGLRRGCDCAYDYRCVSCSAIIAIVEESNS